MNSETVGLENLPNLFINTIKVENIDQSIKLITVTVCMYDEVPHTWKNRSFGINLRMVAVTDLETSEIINSGTHAEEISNFTPYLYLTKSSDSMTEMEYLGENAAGEYKKFIKKFVFTINTDENPNLNIYCYCVIDNLNFGIKEFDKFCGPISGERVFQNGELSDISGYFYDPETNEEYGGPVHAVGSKYYKGSRESETKIEVFYVPEDNMKIKGTVLWNL